MTSKSGTIVIPVEFGTQWNRSDIISLATALETRLGQAAGVCFLDDPVESAISLVQSFVKKGLRRIVVLPLGTSHLNESLPLARMLLAIRGAVSDVHFHAAAPLSWLEWTDWLKQIATESTVQAGYEPSTVGPVVVGHGTRDPIANADLPRIAYLLSRELPGPSATYAFWNEARPGVSRAITHAAREGARHVLIVTWLGDGESHADLERESLEVARPLGVTVSIVSPSLVHPSLLDRLSSKQQEGCSDASLQLYLEFVSQLKNVELLAGKNRVSEAEMTPEAARELEELDRKLNSMLPPEYQGQYESVAPTSMGTAGLKYDSDGNVAWDEIWTSFCDLALAGGPPHRGTLLEAVTAAEVLAEPEEYRAVVREIERGIRMVTGLPLITSRSPGWVGVICESEEMAVWLMRAIIVENVVVRREGDILYLPAGPRFTVKREIKNVITAIAKTVHYWKAHLFSQRDPRRD
ncbi:sirohydrochlorin chelatase [Schlesneria sp. T3-172]|uniref:sirohydrochlorin chelatase n=1 Tax=Schlesneria sphaerica TaxID=3373610 RepID=UPI0037C955FB